MKTITLLSLLITAQSVYSATLKASKSQTIQPQASLPSYAVNMQDGGLILKEKRGGAPLVGVWDWVYRSRSLHKGWFGQGWCSEIEMRLRFESKGELRLWTCHQPRPLTFKLSATSSAYINTEDSEDLIRIRLGHYARFKKDKLVAQFNRQGLALEIMIDKALWSLRYDSRQLPVSIEGPSGQSLSLKWHPVLELVTSLQLRSQPKIVFDYDGFNLRQFSEGTRTYKYAYDDLDNMILWQGPLSTIRFEYYKDKDQIRQIHARCREDYEFPHQSDQKRVGLVKKTCPDNNTITTRFEFHYDGGSSRLPAQVRIEKVNEPFKVAQGRSL